MLCKTLEALWILTCKTTQGLLKNPPIVLFLHVCCCSLPDFEQVFTTPQYRTRNAGTSFIESGPLVSINPLPKPIYVWKKNGVVLVEDGRISVSRDHALYIADLQYADGGTYTCEVENPVMAKRGKLAAKQIAGRYVLTISGECLMFLYNSFIKCRPGHLRRVMNSCSHSPDLDW